MMVKTTINEKDYISIWKESKIERVEVEFSCGGDSMGEVSFQAYNEEDRELDMPADLENYLWDDMYKKVQFYVNSDGHYSGESGTVTIILEQFDEEEGFSYSKDSRAEYREPYECKANIEFHKEEAEFIKKYVKNLHYSSFGFIDGNHTEFEFSCDFFMSDEDERIYYTICEKVCEFFREYVPEIPENYEADFDENATAQMTSNVFDNGEVEFLFTVQCTRYEDSFE